MTEVPTASPKVAGKEPIFRHLDDPDMGFRRVRAQRNADGSESFVRESGSPSHPTRSTCRCTPSTTPA